MTNQHRSAFEIPKDSLAIKLQRHKDLARTPNSRQHFVITTPAQSLRTQQIKKSAI